MGPVRAVGVLVGAIVGVCVKRAMVAVGVGLLSMVMLVGPAGRSLPPR